MTATRLNPTTANALRDAGSGADLTAQYSGSGQAATNWATMWQTNKLVAVDPSQLVRKAVKTVDIAVGNVSVGSGGYTNLTSHVPSAVATEISNGALVLSTLVHRWGSATGAFSVTFASSGNFLYLVGTPNASVTNLTVRMLYV